jgi:hypothetical protein
VKVSGKRTSIQKALLRRHSLTMKNEKYDAKNYGLSNEWNCRRATFAVLNDSNCRQPRSWTNP